MPDRPTPTVAGLLAELHAYRVQTMAPAALAANIDQRRLLAETADCPACNISLRHYQQELYPALAELGATLVAVSPQAPDKGSDLGAELGTGSWELPMPTIVVIDANRVVRFADVHPDWLVRTEADVVIDSVRALVQVPA